MALLLFTLQNKTGFLKKDPCISVFCHISTTEQVGSHSFSHTHTKIRGDP